MSDTLKYFAERIPATFVYAGIDVERNGLLTGTRGEQIAGRFGMLRTSPFPLGPDWTALVAALEAALRLHRHTQGTLPQLDTYLHQRTTGMIGSLLRLIRSAAIQAVVDGTEHIIATHWSPSTWTSPPKPRATIIRALAHVDPKAIQQPQHNPILDRFRRSSTRCPAPSLSVIIWKIWEHLVDQHGAEVSYATVRDYVTCQR